MNRAPPAYRDHLTPWRKDWYAVTVYDCIGELVERDRESGKIRPPRAPFVKIEEWRLIAVDVANKAIERMIGGLS